MGQGRAPFTGWGIAGSSLNPDPGGVEAIYSVLADRGVAIRWDLPPERLPPEVDRLVLWRPGKIQEAEWSALMEWVDTGHTLVAGGDIDRLEGRVGAGDEGHAAPVSAHPATVGLNRVVVGPGSFAEIPGARLVHLARPDGAPVLVSWPHGRGRIFWSADDAWLTNGLIAQADNLGLALQLLHPPAGRQVAFDEFHHGLRRPERWWQVLRGPLLGFTAQAAVALGLFYWAHGIRFGSPRSVPTGPPRAFAEYVYSMSQVYRRACARRFVLRSLHGELVREIRRITGAGGTLPAGELARRTSARTGLPADEIRDLLERLDPAVPQPPPERELIELARRKEELQRRMRDAGYRDRRDHRTGAD